MASDRYSHPSDDRLSSEISDPPRSSSCSRVSGEEYNGDLQEQDYDQHEDSEDTEQERIKRRRKLRTPRMRRVRSQKIKEYKWE
jgi:hypothetical protein